MKTTKISLANLQGKLSRAEMKNSMAGTKPYTGNLVCVTTPRWEVPPSGSANCVGTASQAASLAGAYGWWCCNCQEAYDLCS